MRTAAAPGVAGWDAAPGLGGTGLRSRGATSLAATRLPVVRASEIAAASVAVPLSAIELAPSPLAFVGTEAADGPHATSSKTVSTWPKQTQRVVDTHRGIIATSSLLGLVQRMDRHHVKRRWRANVNATSFHNRIFHLRVMDLILRPT